MEPPKNLVECIRTLAMQYLYASDGVFLLDVLQKSDLVPCAQVFTSRSSDWDPAHIP